MLLPLFLAGLVYEAEFRRGNALTFVNACGFSGITSATFFFPVPLFFTR